MKLISSGASPFVRKVRVVVIETGQQADIEEVRVRTSPGASAADAVRANPLGKLPGLILDDGSTMFDSRVITRYLDDRAGGGLYPADRIWPVLTLEALGDGIAEAALAMVYERRFRQGDKVNEDWIGWQWTKVERALDALESGWGGLLAGPVTAGHIAVGCALGYIDFRLPQRDWRAPRPALAAWFADFGTRPSMRQTAPSD